MTGGGDLDDPWRIELTARARRDLARLPDRVAVAVVEFITGPLATAPTRLSKSLTGELSGYRSARRGDYRVLLELRPGERVISVARIGHRAHVYRPD